MLHEILTSETPFPNKVTDSIPTLSEIELDPLALSMGMNLLCQYCNSTRDFPTATLKSSHVSEGGVIFVKRLMAVNPLAYLLRALWGPGAYGC